MRQLYSYFIHQQNRSAQIHWEFENCIPSFFPEKIIRKLDVTTVHGSTQYDSITNKYFCSNNKSNFNDMKNNLSYSSWV